MKKTIILISITVLIFSGILISNETKSHIIIPESKMLNISGKINAIMTDIPSVQGPVQGAPLAFIKIKVKDDKTGQEHSIQIAPGNFLKLNGVLLQKDDPIIVKAFKSQDPLNLKSLEINFKGKVLKLRDNFGKGLWEKPMTTIREKKPFKR